MTKILIFYYELNFFFFVNLCLIENPHPGSGGGEISFFPHPCVRVGSVRSPYPLKQKKNRRA